MNKAKALVWVMSGLILALLAVLVVGLSLGWHLEDPQPGASISNGPNSGGLVTFDVVNLGQPQGTVVAGIAELNGRLAVSLSGGGIAPRIVLIDSSNGEIFGRIQISSPGE